MKHSYRVGDRVRATSKVDKGFWWKPGFTGTVEQVKAASIVIGFDTEYAPWGEGIVTAATLHYIAPIKRVDHKPTLASDLAFKPSTRRILAHMRSKGSITVLEALASYGTARIAPAIYDLRNGGYDIETVAKKDPGGHNYTRYVLKAA